MSFPVGHLKSCAIVPLNDELTIELNLSTKLAVTSGDFIYLPHRSHSPLRLL